MILLLDNIDFIAVYLLCPRFWRLFTRWWLSGFHILDFVHRSPALFRLEQALVVDP